MPSGKLSHSQFGHQNLVLTNWPSFSFRLSPVDQKAPVLFCIGESCVHLKMYFKMESIYCKILLYLFLLFFFKTNLRFKLRFKLNSVIMKIELYWQSGFLLLYMFNPKTQYAFIYFPSFYHIYPSYGAKRLMEVFSYA